MPPINYEVFSISERRNGERMRVGECEGEKATPEKEKTR
jgi:hypothetical protein